MGIDSLQYARDNIQEMSQFLKVISDPTRLAILLLLYDYKELSVGEIVDRLEMEQSAVSHQLILLKNNRLVKAERSGKRNIYSLDDFHIFTIIDQVIEHLREKCD